jgi:hypothetical protein
MRKVYLIIFFALLALSLSSCLTGPQKLKRGWDDCVNNYYTQNAWTTAVLTDVIPVYPLVGWFATMGDYLFVNPYYFWGYDAWTNKGTPFYHDDPAY